MASSLDDMPAYEHFQVELDLHLRDFLKKNPRPVTFHYHFFIEFITFHRHLEKISEVTDNHLKEFIAWINNHKNNSLHENKLLDEVNEFSRYLRSQTK